MTEFELKYGRGFAAKMCAILGYALFLYISKKKRKKSG